MKSDREMTESLIKRRDEYLANAKKRACIGLIPKTVIPLFGIFAVILCVLALNGVFDRNKIDIDLTGANSNILNSENFVLSSITGDSDKTVISETEQDTDDSEPNSVISQIEAAISQAEEEISRDKWISVSDVLNSVLHDSELTETNNGPWFFEQLTLGLPKRVVCDGAIYRLVDPDEADYLSLGFDPDTSYIADDLPKVTVFEYVEESYGEAETVSVTGSFYSIIGMEGYITALYKGQFMLYRAERAAQFTVGDRVYFARLSLAESMRFGISEATADENDEYIVLYAADNLDSGRISFDESGSGSDKSVYVVMSKMQEAGEMEEIGDAWICYAYPAAPREYRLNINIYGRVEDTVERITDYFRGFNRGDFYYDPYSLISLNLSGEYENVLGFADYEQLVYMNKSYALIENYYTAADTVLVQKGFGLKEAPLGNGEEYFCTVFGVKGADNVLAVFCDDGVHYFMAVER